MIDLRQFLPGIQLEYPSKKRVISSKIGRRDRQIARIEKRKPIKRFDIINYLIEYLDREVTYLEIGVRNPESNFKKIRASKKYSVDPGLEHEINLADFKMTSDEFFSQLSGGKILDSNIEFDVIFIDGLHFAEQVDKDIENSLKYLKEDGFVVLHDCNPPTEWHARENYDYIGTPGGTIWNGTTWKAFMKWRMNPSVYSCCIDTDWGVGVLSKEQKIGDGITFDNPFFEYYKLSENRKEWLNLIQFDELKELLPKP